MTSRSPIDDERDLDRWVQEVTEDWQMRPMAAGQATWQERVASAPSGRWRVSRFGLRMGAGVAGIAAVLLIGVVVATSLLNGHQTGPAALPSAGESAQASPTGGESHQLEVSGEARNGDFQVAIVADKSTYAANEPIRITTQFQYAGRAALTVTGSGEGLMAFGIVQLDGPIDMAPARTSDCRQYTFQPGAPQTIPFQKSGGFSETDPMAAFWRAYFADPQLHLPAGHYRISAEVVYGVPACGNEQTLTASVLIVVQ